MFINLTKIKARVFDYLLPTFIKGIFSLKLRPGNFRMFIDTKCLVLVPRPGDETLAMGGFMAKQPKNFEVLSMTDGSKSFPGKMGVDARFARKKEFSAAMELLRVRGHKIFEIEEGTLFDNYHKFSKLDVSEADYIFVPDIFSQNVDAKALLVHLQKLLKEKEHKDTLKIAFFEGHSALSLPNCFVDISSTIGVKREMMSLYASQKEENIYKEGIVALNKYRASGIGGEFVECFMLMDVESFSSLAELIDGKKFIENL